jgi:hypothetical protein
MSLHGRFLNGCAGFFLARLRPTRASFGRPSSRRGLPQITRKDNASPFAGHGAGGLSRLSFPGRDAARSFSGPASPGKTATMTTRHRTLERKRRKGRNSRQQAGLSAPGSGSATTGAATKPRAGPRPPARNRH